MNIPILRLFSILFLILGLQSRFFLGHLFLAFALATDSYLRMGFGK